MGKYSIRSIGHLLKLQYKETLQGLDELIDISDEDDLEFFYKAIVEEDLKFVEFKFYSEIHGMFCDIRDLCERCEERAFPDEFKYMSLNVNTESKIITRLAIVYILEDWYQGRDSEDAGFGDSIKRLSGNVSNLNRYTSMLEVHNSNYDRIAGSNPNKMLDILFKTWGGMGGDFL